MKSFVTKGLSSMLTAVGTLSVLAGCVNESFYSNTRRYDTYTQIEPADTMDFLFILDNSPTMVPKIAYIKAQMGNFLTDIEATKPLNWQLALGTTAFFDFNGRDLPIFDCASPANAYACQSINNGLLRVATKTSGSGQVDFDKMLEHFAPPFTGVSGCPDNLAQFQECGHLNTFISFWEEPLNYIQKMLTTPSIRTNFSRLGVPLSIIVVTDTTDSSCLGNCSGSKPEESTNYTKLDTADFLTLLRSIKAGEGTYVNFFTIHSNREEDWKSFAQGGCQAEYSEIEGITTATFPTNGGSPVDKHWVAPRLSKVAKDYGERGFVGNVCDLTLSGAAGAFNQVAAIIRDRGSLFRLSDVPNGNLNMRVFVNGSERPSTDFGLRPVGDEYFLEFLSNYPADGDTISVIYESGT